MKNLFSDFETSIKIKLGVFWEKLAQRHNRREQVRRFDLISMIVRTKIVPSFNSYWSEESVNWAAGALGFRLQYVSFAWYQQCKIWSQFTQIICATNPNYILVIERNIESTFIKKTNHIIPLKIGDIQILEIMNFQGGARILDSFLKVYKTSEAKRFFPYEWFNHLDKTQSTELPPYDAFYSSCRSSNSLGAEYTDSVNLLKNGLTTQQDVIKLETRELD